MSLLDLEPCTVHAYAITTGEHLYRLPYSAAQWQESIKQPGSLSVTVPLSREAKQLDLWDTLRPWKCLIALQRGRSVIHAGPLTDLQWDAGSRSLSLTCGGGLTLLTTRLVLNSALKDGWRDGTVLVDEEHPAANMTLAWKRTWWWVCIVRLILETLVLNSALKDGWRDGTVLVDEEHPAANMTLAWKRTWWWVCIVRLILETKKWQDLPIDLPSIEEPGDKQRTYFSWDLATVADRISDIMNLSGGNEVVFDPYLTPDNHLRFELRAGKPELITTTHRWDTTLPDSRVDLESVSGSGSNLTNQVWATGGKDSDKTLMCRRTATPLAGYGLMQSANTAHTTVERLSTLQQHATGQLANGCWPDETFSLKVGEEWAPHVGDHAITRVDDDYLGSQTLELKVTDISGDTGSDLLTVTCKEVC